MTIWMVLGSAIVLATLPGTLELLALTIAGILPAQKRAPRHFARTLRLAVIVPAHNEELNIARCVKSLFEADQEGVDLAIVVVADNCTDRTAVIAARAGARVLVRTDADNRGKGYALDFAFRTLLPEGHDAFAVVDADSEVALNFLCATAEAFKRGGDAAQCRYVVRNTGASVRTRLMNVALLAFNVLRPRGRQRLGLSCGIFGNGFALSADTLRAVPYTAASVVEDLEYHLALARTGRRVVFVDDTAVYGDMPAAGEGVKTQRARWEGGRFRMMAAQAPGLAFEVLRGKWRVMEPLLDLLLLPLAFHTMLLIVATVSPWWFPREVGLAGLTVIALHLCAAIRVGGGGLREISVLGTAPFYIAWKILLLPRVIRASRSNTAWVRTARAREGELP